MIEELLAENTKGVPQQSDNFVAVPQDTQGHVHSMASQFLLSSLVLEDYFAFMPQQHFT